MKKAMGLTLLISIFLFTYTGGQEKIEKKQSLIIINKKDSIITYPELYFKTIEMDKIISIETIDDEKVIKNSVISNIKSIIKIEMRDSIVSSQ
jgi:hypothetical protein